MTTGLIRDGGERPSRLPSSVAELATMRAWTVAAPKRTWATAERAIDMGSHRWVIGLTPITGGAVALIPWRDNAVVAKLRGSVWGSKSRPPSLTSGFTRPVRTR